MFDDRTKKTVRWEGNVPPSVAIIDYEVFKWQGKRNMYKCFLENCKLLCQNMSAG